MIVVNVSTAADAALLGVVQATANRALRAAGLLGLKADRVIRREAGRVVGDACATIPGAGAILARMADGFMRARVEDLGDVLSIAAVRCDSRQVRPAQEWHLCALEACLVVWTLAHIAEIPPRRADVYHVVRFTHTPEEE